MSDYSITRADDVEDSYAGSDVPGKFRSLKEALGAEQVAVTLIRVPPHSDFEQETGHFHEELEEIYIVTRGTLKMRFDDAIEEVKAGAVVRVAPDGEPYLRPCSAPRRVLDTGRSQEAGDYADQARPS